MDVNEVVKKEDKRIYRNNRPALTRHVERRLMEKERKECYQRFYMTKQMDTELRETARDMGGIYIAAVVRIAIRKFLDQRREEKKKIK